jgi:signal transduction histidine kinase
MTERVKKLGGELQVVSHTGQGTSILATLPIANSPVTEGPVTENPLDHEENLRLVGR